MKKRYLLSILLIGVVISSFSNNIQISNVTLVGKNTTDNYVLIQFDLSWDNSWRTSSGPANWDAAWIFVKYTIKGQNNWLHATLNWVDGTGTGDGHTVPAGAVIRASDNVGVFIYSSADKAQSSAAYAGVQLRWNYGTDGLQDSDLVEICVFGIEMVYVPEGEFEVGNLFLYGFQKGATSPSAFVVNTEGQINISSGINDLYYQVGGDGTGPLSLKFPKGFSDFYCMKYEVTQEQYVEFLLKLSINQASNRAYVINLNRHKIAGTFGTYYTENPFVACNFLSWADLAAYLDWCGLRPMSELEFEKACRGAAPSIPGEYAWGSTSITGSSYTLSDAGAENEAIATLYNVIQGNLMYESTDDNIAGPVRVGIFAAHPNNNGRVTAGATYYGIMEMSGNVIEQVVTIGNDAGRAFQDHHGDGNITASGEHDTPTWPAADGNGAGQRGGSWSSQTGIAGVKLFVSTRTDAAMGAQNRHSEIGGRGVRTAP